MKISTKQQEKLFYIEILACMMEQGYKWTAACMIYDAVGFINGIKLVKIISRVRY